MSSSSDPDPHRLSGAGVARYRGQTHLAIHEENRRWDAVFGFGRGVGVGALLGGLILILLAPLFAISSIDVLGVVLALGLAGGGYGVQKARARQPDPPLATPAENLAQQTALDEHRGVLEGIAAEFAVLRSSGLDPQKLEERALQQADLAHSRLCDRLGPQHPVLSQASARVSAAIPAPVATGGPFTPSADPSDHARVGTPLVPLAVGTNVELHGIPLIPDELLTAQRARKIVPFVGAGLSLGRDVKGNFPRWSELPLRILAEFRPHHWRGDHDRRTIRGLFLEPDLTNPGQEKDITMPLVEMLSKLDFLKTRLDPDYPSVLTKIFRPGDSTPGSAHRAVLALDAPFVLTTNYDQLFEALEGPTVRQAYTWRQSARALADVERRRRVLFKVHGSAEDEESVVLTASEYARAHADPAYRLIVHHLLAGSTFLFIGYGMSDPSDLDIILEENAAALKRPTPHFALLHRDQAGTLRQGELRRKYNIVAIPLDDHSQILPFLEALAGA